MGALDECADPLYALLHSAVGDADDGPAAEGEEEVDVAVALHVAAQLALPVGGHLGEPFGAGLLAVPELAVDEDGDLLAGERDVGTAGRARVVEPVAEPAPGQLAPQGEFGLRVPPADAAHHLRALGRAEGVAAFGHCGER